MTTPQTTIPPINVMLDIETYGTAPGSVIKTIGAVKFAIVDEQDIDADKRELFTITKPTILDRFYRRISVESSAAAGLKMDAPTVEWWLQQSDQARAEMVKPGEALANVLEGFALWLGLGAEVWGNGVGFDNVLVRSAFAAVGIDCPWSHVSDRCYRTVKNANRDLSIDAYRVRTHHNALDDAESQAMHLMAIWQRDEKRRQSLDVLTRIVNGGIRAENADEWEEAQSIVS